MQLTSPIPRGVDPGVAILAPPSARRTPATDATANGLPLKDEHPNVPGPITPVPLSGPAGAPQPRQPGTWTFAALGDYGSGSAEQAEVAASLLARSPDMVLTLGDNVYQFGLGVEYHRHWDPPELFGKIRSTIPVFPSLGNHDLRITPQAYFHRFPELAGARYYDFHRGGIHFLAVDSNQSLAPGSEQHAWLERELAASTDAFRVLYMHHPVKSSAPRSEGSRMEEFLGPLLARHGVDLVLTGHEHHYERSGPLNEYGTIQVIHGGGGAEVHPFVTPPGEWSLHRNADFGHLEFEVRGDALIGRNILRDGTEEDTFVVPRHARQAAIAGASLIPLPAAA